LDLWKQVFNVTLLVCILHSERTLHVLTFLAKHCSQLHGMELLSAH
jgi:hypothetical protein